MRHKLILIQLKHGMSKCVQMCFEWFTKGQHDLESDVQQQLFKEKILKLEPYEITMNGERRHHSLSGLLYK